MVARPGRQGEMKRREERAVEGWNWKRRRRCSCAEEGGGSRRGGRRITAELEGGRRSRRWAPAVLDVSKN